jgi:hypothetical protein
LLEDFPQSPYPLRLSCTKAVNVCKPSPTTGRTNTDGGFPSRGFKASLVENVTVSVQLERLVYPGTPALPSPVPAGYFYDTFAYEICFYGIYFYGIYIYGIYFYKALKFMSINCTVVRNT